MHSPDPVTLRLARLVLALATTAIAGPIALADEAPEPVRSVEELRRALAAAKPGTRVRIAPGTYSGGLSFEGLRGEPGRPVTLEAADPAKPPVFRGGAAGLHLTDPVHVVLKDLAFEGQTGNGINIDDGGTFDTPAHHLTLERLSVSDVGPDGNGDGIKLSGVTDFRLVRCTVERWGRDGSAVDMVGCARGTVEECTFRQDPRAGGSGVQAKGGTRDVAVRRSRFFDAGARAVNAGGSTGLAYFRPALSAWKGERFEAADLRIEGNVFSGGEAAAAFVGVDGGVFRFNTVHVPRRWALRILQETREPGFVPARRVTVADNLVVFRSDRWSEGGVNVGDGTDPGSFRFERNVWYCADAPDRTRALVRPPVAESGGVHGRDPLLVAPASGDYSVRAGSPAAKAGAHALRD